MVDSPGGTNGLVWRRHMHKKFKIILWGIPVGNSKKILLCAFEWEYDIKYSKIVAGFVGELHICSCINK